MTFEVDLTDLPVNDLVKRYVEIRDELSEERKKFTQFEESAKEMMARISMALKAAADKMGVNSFNTDDGTAYRNVKKSYRVGNWDQIIEFIRQTENWSMLEKRIAKLATMEVHNATGQVPPGVEYLEEEEFLVRRPKKG
jgi:hypothetical protein